MNTSDPLAEFYSSTPRESRDLSGRTGTYGAVDAALNELRLPAALDDDGDWKLESDVGRLNMLVDELTGDFVVIQSLHAMEVQDSTDFMHALLRLNFDTRGFARFGAIFQGGQNIFVITARVPGGEVSAASVGQLVGDAMRLSRRLDALLAGPPGEGVEGTGELPAEPAPAAEPATAGTEPPAAEPATAGAEPPAAEPATAGTEPPAAEPGSTAAEPGSTAAEPPPADQPPAAAPAAATVFAQPVPTGQPPDQGAAAATGAAEGPPPVADSPPPAAEQPAPAEPAPAASYPPPSVEPAAPAQPEAPQQPQQQDYPPPVHTPEYPPPTYPPPQPDLPPPNWYPDPYYQARLRYWDGQQWTEHVAQ